MTRRLALPALSVLGLFACSLDDREFPDSNPQPGNRIVGGAGSGSSPGGGGSGGSGGNASSTSNSSSSVSSSGSAGGGGGGVGGGGSGALLYSFCGCVEASQNAAGACDTCLWDPVANGCELEWEPCQMSANCQGILATFMACPQVDATCMDLAAFADPGGVVPMFDYLTCACSSCMTECPGMQCQ